MIVIREYRAFPMWRKDEVKWYGSDKWEFEYLKVHSIHIGTKKIIVSGSGGNVSVPFCDVSLEESTPFVDKYGNTIFINDIIMVWGKYYVVKFDDTYGRYIIVSYEENGRVWAKSDLSNFISEDSEIVGDIHRDRNLVYGRDNC